MISKVERGEFAAAAYVRIWAKRIAKDLGGKTARKGGPSCCKTVPFFTIT